MHRVYNNEERDQWSMVVDTCIEHLLKNYVLLFGIYS